jgi:cell division septation protein DedD
MPRNDEGEFELVLGNKHLLSLFFIVVVLLGVFFAMGYIVGRNSVPERTETAAPPTVIEPKGTEPSPMPQASSERPPTAPPETKQPETAPPPETDAQEAPRPAPTAASDALPKGSYWQVAAVKRPEGELLVEMLTKKGFQARLAPAPGTDGLLRVLVGPAQSTPQLAQLKTDLESAGYKKPIRRDE